MAINNLSGNFQPLTPVSGRSLPHAESQSANAPPSAIPKQTQVQSTEVRKALSALQDNAEKAAVGRTEKRAQSERYEELSQLSQNISRRLSFQIDDDSGKTVVRVFDRETEELIRQFPPDELLTLSKRLKELSEDTSGNAVSGVLIKSEA